MTDPLTPPVPVPAARSCPVTHPLFGVACELVTHPHRRAHRAGGVVDGVEWALIWWDPQALVEQPDVAADGSGRVLDGGHPRQARQGQASGIQACSPSPMPSARASRRPSRGGRPTASWSRVAGSARRW